MTHNYIIPTYGLEAWSAIFYGRIKSFLFHTLIRCGQVTQTVNTGLATGVLKIIQDLAIKKPRKPQIIRVRFIHKIFLLFNRSPDDYISMTFMCGSVKIITINATIN